MARNHVLITEKTYLRQSYMDTVNHVLITEKTYLRQSYMNTVVVKQPRKQTQLTTSLNSSCVSASVYMYANPTKVKAIIVPTPTVVIHLWTKWGWITKHISINHYLMCALEANMLSFAIQHWIDKPGPKEQNEVNKQSWFGLPVEPEMDCRQTDFELTVIRRIAVCNGACFTKCIAASFRLTCPNRYHCLYTLSLQTECNKQNIFHWTVSVMI